MDERWSRRVVGVLSACVIGGLSCGHPPTTVEHQRDGAQPTNLPNLTIDRARLLSDLAIEERVFETTACELDPDEACIDRPGLRRLLRFSVEVPNIGDADLNIGPPGEPLFQYSQCHNHNHFSGFASYVLTDASGAPFTTGHKQAFCLVDTNRYVIEPDTPESRRFSCNHQGIQRGWSDVYDSSLACQFIDITDVPDGAYTLTVHINHERLIEESDYSDDVLQIPITLGDPMLETPTEPCPDDASATADITRECGWSLVGTWPCIPGETLSVGCAEDCALGACTGDPMLRVCASSRSDGNCSHAASLGRGDNACGSNCPQASGIQCPLSAAIDVYATSRDAAQSYTCDVAIRTL